MNSNPNELGTLVIVVIASVAVLAPVLLGWGLGHIPKGVAVSLALPLFLFSAASVVGTLWMGRQKKDLLHLGVSTLFGLFFVALSLKANSVEGEALKKIRWMFLVFGVTWLLLSFYPYVSRFL